MDRMAQPETSTGLGQIGQIALTVSDIARAVTFYRDSLGMQFLFQLPSLAFFDCNGSGEVLLWTISGTEVAHLNISGGLTWNAAGLADGMYIAKKTCNGVKTRKKFVIVR